MEGQVRPSVKKQIGMLKPTEWEESVMWKRKREMHKHLLDPTYWLGTDANDRIDAGDSGAILGKLYRWQHAIGTTGSPIPRDLEPLSVSLQHEIASMRERLADTITAVSRIHGVTVPLTLSRHWSDLNYADMKYALDFCAFAVRTGKRSGCTVHYSGENPSRLVGSYGFSGYLKIRITGTQFALEDFMQSVRTVYPSVARDLERHSTVWKKRTPIPPYQQARQALERSLISVPTGLLRKDLITTREAINELESLGVKLHAKGKPASLGKRTATPHPHAEHTPGLGA